MSPYDFRAAIRSVDMTIDDAAQVLGVSRSQVYRYAAGTNPVPEPVARLLRAEINACMAHCYGPAKWQGYRHGRPMGPMVERRELAYAFALDLPR